MRKSILKAMLSIAILTIGTYAAQAFSSQPYGESYGFSSEDLGGGSYLGVDTRDIRTDRLSALKLKEEHGVEVTLVDQDAPAGKRSEERRVGKEGRDRGEPCRRQDKARRYRS